MKSNIKNFFIIAVSLIIISFSFIIPTILLKIEDVNLEKEIDNKTKTKNTIDVEAEKIYLVKAIHSIEDVYASVSISNKKVAIAPTYQYTIKDDASISKAQNEIIKMKDLGILENNFIQEENEKVSYGITERVYSGIYYLNGISLTSQNYTVNVVLEDKTSKITALYIVKNSGELDIIDIAKKKQILEDYIKYLDLYIIGDWKFENNMLISEKAQLTASLIIDNKSCILSIHSSQFNNNNLVNNYYKKVN